MSSRFLSSSQLPRIEIESEGVFVIERLQTYTKTPQKHNLYFFYKVPRRKPENNLFTMIIKMYIILFAHAIITSTAIASSVYLQSNVRRILLVHQLCGNVIGAAISHYQHNFVQLIWCGRQFNCNFPHFFEALRRHKKAICHFLN